MMDATAAAVMIVLALGAGWLVPALAVRALLAGFASGPLVVANHRGRRIPPVLGLAWLVWALTLLAAQVLVDVAIERGWEVPGATGLLERIGTTPFALPLFVVPFILVVGCVALGLADDAFGAGGPKGFGGHVRALRHGRLTTGMLKMLGVGALAVFYGANAASSIIERTDIGGADSAGVGWYLVAWLLATLVIALAANLLNLLDLRPGRALKAYLVLVPAPAAVFAVASVASYNADVAAYSVEISGLVLAPWATVLVAIALVIVMLGPAIAVWSPDLRERAMLGDSGANAMGAIVGYLLTGTLDLVGIAIAAAVLLALNLLSERVSFSAIIERVGTLAFLDRLGRTPEAVDVPETADPPKQAPEAAPRPPGVLYHADEDPVTKED
jgi:hypothetical protein